MVSKETTEAMIKEHSRLQLPAIKCAFDCLNIDKNMSLTLIGKMQIIPKHHFYSSSHLVCQSSTVRLLHYNFFHVQHEAISDSQALISIDDH